MTDTLAPEAIASLLTTIVAKLDSIEIEMKRSNRKATNTRKAAQHAANSALAVLDAFNTLPCRSDDAGCPMRSLVEARLNG